MRYEDMIGPKKQLFRNSEEFAKYRSELDMMRIGSYRFGGGPKQYPVVIAWEIDSFHGHPAEVQFAKFVYLDDFDVAPVNNIEK